MIDRLQRRDKIQRTAATVVVVAIIVAVVLIDRLKTSELASATATTTPLVTSQPSVSTSPTSQATSTPSPTSQVASTTYKNGTYTAQSNYSVPHSNEAIQVSLTVTNDVVTSVGIENTEGDPTSADYQEQFAAEYKSHVVGKSLSGLAISTIAGASDTTQGFNNALRSIRSQANA